VRAHTIRQLLAVAAGVVLAIGGCTNIEESTRDADGDQAVVNGKIEPGYAAVGSLSCNPQGWSNCSGTLVTLGAGVPAKWVLTAAHCVTKQDPKNCSFMFADENGSTVGQRRFATKRFIPHPHFDAWFNANDVALVELSERDEVPENIATPYPLNRAPLDWGITEGMLAIQVGFGRTDPETPETFGLKRSGTVPIFHVGHDEIVLRRDSSESQIAALGDSGGLCMIADQERTVAAVISRATGSNDHHLSVVVRVDRYIDWIEAAITDQKLDCRASPCSCPQGCQKDPYNEAAFICSPVACRPLKRWLDIVECLGGSERERVDDLGRLQACLSDSTFEAQDDFSCLGACRACVADDTRAPGTCGESCWSGTEEWVRAHPG
jgi:hypothetical protein